MPTHHSRLARFSACLCLNCLVPDPAPTQRPTAFTTIPVDSRLQWRAPVKHSVVKS